MERVSRKERERQRRQREFLDTAEEVFSQKGFHNATLQEISERSEFAIGSIYYMFRNKDEIYTALLRMRMEEYISLLEDRIRGSDGPLDKVRAVIEAKLHFFSEHKPFLRLYLNTTLTSGGDVRAEAARELIQRYEDYLNLLAGVFEEGIRKRVFAGNDPMGMALAMEGMLHALFTYWIHHENDPGPLPRLSTIETILLRGILKPEKNRKR